MYHESIVYLEKIRLKGAENMLKKILVPTDGSSSSRAALEKAVDLAKLTDAEIVLYHVSLTPEGVWGMMPPGGAVMIDEEIVNTGNYIIKETLHNVDTGNVKISEVVQKGRPAQKIIDYANKNDFDMVIVGSVGHGAFTGSLIGSVSQKILSASKVPVLLVKDEANQAYVLNIYG